MLSSLLVGVTSIIEEDVTGSLTGDEALTFCNVLDAVTILVMVVVAIAVVFVNRLLLTCRTYTQEIKQKGSVHIQVYFMVKCHVKCAKS